MHGRRPSRRRGSWSARAARWFAPSAPGRARRWRRCSAVRSSSTSACACARAGARTRASSTASGSNRVARAMATDANAEATAAWDGPLFERFVQFQHLLVTGLASHGEKALSLYPPPPGANVLDVGCGFGDTTERIAGMVSANGHAHGVDVAPRFIEAAMTEVRAPNASFSVSDVQFDDLGGPYDYVFSRMGVMFFDNPGAAMRNIRRSIAPGGRLVAVVWRMREDNPWMYEAQLVVERMLGRPEEYDEPT